MDNSIYSLLVKKVFFISYLKSSKIRILSVALILFFIAAVGKWLINKDTTSYSTWLWDTSVIETDMEHTVESILNMNIHSVYLQYSSKVSNDTYRNFISSLQKEGVEVYALDGAPDWGITDHESKDQFLDWFHNYQADALSHEQFKGIHLDIEPYLLENWDTNQEEIIYQYQTLLLQIGNFAENLNATLGVDIPFWFDEITYDNKYGQGYLSQWLIQNTDETTIMAYRNFAEGKNGIIDLSTQEVDWAEQENKNITIAVETEKTPEEHVSFYNKNKHTLVSEIKHVQNHYKGRIAGIAIHSFESMIERSE
ncbi:hypothetical protein QPK24_23190 [Paenibacillus polygoni]|uniref:Amidase n=1 Tax=Paenibacillus polygoni TaxID=3050112 RepID=A0ABY8X3Z9_9BACL|nr:hypothetical protein [Paenibacillus polygoni]WIV19182.1 hypothetical protein QPK24_23190 [Paenibacillus polygoni]